MGFRVAFLKSCLGRHEFAAHSEWPPEHSSTGDSSRGVAGIAAHMNFLDTQTTQALGVETCSNPLDESRRSLSLQH